jgi:glucose-1-phosphate thymidylyltransferase
VEVRGVILAGGLGTRLFPLTKITNKHLLPVYDKPMIYYPIQTLVNAGIREVLLVTGGSSTGDFLRLLGDGSRFGLLRINYAFQEREGGIAEALGLAEHFAEDGKVVVMLGDNILEKSIRKVVYDFKRQKRGARILLKEVERPQDYGVAEIQGGKIRRVVEKPKRPKSNLAVIGVYMYDASVFRIVKNLKPSARGELEITDVNNVYIRRGQMYYNLIEGWWGDAGSSMDGLLDANIRVRELAGRKGCIWQTHAVQKETRN